MVGFRHREGYHSHPSAARAAVLLDQFGGAGAGHWTRVVRSSGVKGELIVGKLDRVLELVLEDATERD